MSNVKYIYKFGHEASFYYHRFNPVYVQQQNFQPPSNFQQQNPPWQTFFGPSPPWQPQPRPPPMLFSQIGSQASDLHQQHMLQAPIILIISMLILVLHTMSLLNCNICRIKFILNGQEQVFLGTVKVFLVTSFGSTSFQSPLNSSVHLFLNNLLLVPSITEKLCQC